MRLQRSEGWSQEICMTPIVLSALVAVLAGLLLASGALAARRRAAVSRQG